MKKIILLLFGLNLVNIALAENKPSIEFSVKPEIFYGVGVSEKETEQDIGVNGEIRINLKLLNDFYNNYLVLDKVFGLYFNNTYSFFYDLSKPQGNIFLGAGFFYFDSDMMNLKTEIGGIYNPSLNKWGFDCSISWCLGGGSYGIRSSFLSEKINMEFFVGYSFCYDINEKKNWIETHTHKSEKLVKDVPDLYFKIVNSDKNFETIIYTIPVTIEYYTDKKGNVVLKTIRIKKHSLGEGELGSKEYINLKEIEVVYTNYDDAFVGIVEEYDVLLEKKRREQENEQILQEKHDLIYNEALKSIEGIIKYINENQNTKFFRKEAYQEIAKKITKNNNIRLVDLPYITNPYNLEKDCLYFVSQMKVFQWTGNGSFLAEVSRNNIFIRNVYDLSKIETTIQNVFLKYTGTFEYTSTSNVFIVVPEFDLVYSF